jgi:hypothetical protein
MKIPFLLLATLALSGAALVQAQTVPQSEPVFADGLLRSSAVVQAWDGKTLQLKSAEGSLSIELPAEVIITKRLASSLSAVKPGMFLGSAAVLGADGKLHAKEIHIIPDALRGGTGGQRAMSEANTSMTNGSVGTLTDGSATLTQGSANGMVMTLSFPNGQQQIQVASDVPVTMVTQVSRDLLRSGDQVSITAQRDAGGSAVIQRIDLMSPATP